VIHQLESIILAAQRKNISGSHPPTTLKHNEDVSPVEDLR